MINSKKKGFTNVKGFTIVELVIVIAVVAILAAVLIPTFSNLVKKANLSSDQQAVRQMNTTLAIAGNPSDINSAIDALADAGYNSKDSLIPVSTGYSFYWYPSTKTIVLVKENIVVFPEGVEYDASGTLLESSSKYINIESSDKKTLFEAFQNGNTEIKLSGDAKVDSLLVPTDAEISFDLNNKNIESSLQINYENKHNNALDVYGKIIVKNGTINTRNVYVHANAEVILENVTINALDYDGGACVFIEEGAKVTIKECILNTKSYTYAVTNNGGEVVIENATITADRGCVANNSGTTIINSGTFKVTAKHSEAMHILYTENGSITVNGGTFTNEGTQPNFYVSKDGTGTIKLVNGEVLEAGESK